VSVHFGVDYDDGTTRSSIDLVGLVREFLPRAAAHVQIFSFPPGEVCRIWRALAQHAFVHEPSDMAVLLGPSFPVLARTHALWLPEIFPVELVNTHADPFLFQIYRAFGAARIEPRARLTNHIGGALSARYEKTHVNWNGELLSRARHAGAKWLRQPSCALLTTVDVIVPTYRVPRERLEAILALRVPAGVSTQFIIICDRPGHAAAERVMSELQASRRDDPMVRLRTNASNIGAGLSRNRGLTESAADWVLFLDDDVLPDPELLESCANSICAHPNATGFIGFTELPQPVNARQAAVHMAGVAFFWSAARTYPHELELP
jgi:hypothetical protein